MPANHLTAAPAQPQPSGDEALVEAMARAYCTAEPWPMLTDWDRLQPENQEIVRSRIRAALAILRAQPDARAAALEEALKQIAISDTHHEAGVQVGVGANGWPTFALKTTKGRFALIAEAAHASASQPVPAPDGWQPTHRHVKHGSEYRVIGQAELVAQGSVPEGCHLIIYQGKGGLVWARPAEEFKDGRFFALPAPPARPVQP